MLINLYTSSNDLDSQSPHAPMLARALLNAVGADGRSAPNPVVGAVIERGGEILAQGATEAFGQRHGEVVALAGLPHGTTAYGASLYVTLEPCAHHGKQPPCVDAILASGISKVIIGARDNNPQVSGLGGKRLAEAGLEVVYAEDPDCMLWHLPFRFYHQFNRPFVVAKWAQTLDGALAEASGKSKWISAGESRLLVHHLRQHYDAIMVGAGTVVSDDPSLTVRDLPAIHRQPLPVVWDPHGRVSESWLAGKKRGVYFGPAREGIPFFQVDPAGASPGSMIASLNSEQFLEYHDGRPIHSLLVEGGPKLLSLLLDEHAIDYGHVFTAPRFLGAREHRVNSHGRLNEEAQYLFIGARLQGSDIITEFCSTQAHQLLRAKSLGD